MTTLAGTPLVEPVAGRTGEAPRPPVSGVRRVLTRPARVPPSALVALATAMSGTALLAWGLGRPALWLDESASAVAARRSWTGLWRLVGGDETPMLPYYAMLKLATVAQPERTAAWLRLPSLVAAVTAATALAFWLARRHGVRLACATTLVLLGTAGFSRYGQEARSYALVLLMSVLSSAAWSALVRTRRRRWMAGYAATVALLLLCHLMAGLLVLAHLGAAAVSGQRWRRPAAVLGTAAGSALGVAAVLPFVLVAVHAKGATVAPPLTVGNLVTAIGHLLSVAPHPPLGLGLVPLLALAGLSRAGRGRHAELARLAACWALLPTTIWPLLVMARPNLLLGRYLLFTVPGWAVLAGLGVLVVAEQAARLTRRLAGNGVTGVTAPAAAAALAAVAVTAGLLVWTQAPGLRSVRGPAGHGEDIRPALAAAAAPAVRHLPIVVGTRFSAIEISAYRPGWDHRLIGLQPQSADRLVWPTRTPSPVRADQLRLAPAVLFLMRAPADRWPSAAARPGVVQQAMPRWLQARGYRVQRIVSADGRWITAVVARPAGPA